METKDGVTERITRPLRSARRKGPAGDEGFLSVRFPREERDEFVIACARAGLSSQKVVSTIVTRILAEIRAGEGLARVVGMEDMVAARQAPTKRDRKRKR
jgi:hypothetical protein